MTTGWIVAYAALWVAVVLVGLTALGLLRRMNAVLAASADRSTHQHGLDFGPPTGSDLPDFTARRPDGSVVQSSSLREQGAAVYLFVSPGCGPCMAICDQLRSTGWQEPTPLVAVTYDSLDGRHMVGGLPGATALLQHDGEVFDAFGVRPTPFAIAVDDECKVVGSRVPGSASDLRALAHRPSREAAPTDLVQH